MPPEYYLGAAVGIVILGLLASFFRSGASRRRIPDQSIDTAQLVSQLSRIADSLEKLVVHLGASPSSVGQPTVPPAHMPETPASDDAKGPESPERHVRMSMFGR